MKIMNWLVPIIILAAELLRIGSIALAIYAFAVVVIGMSYYMTIDTIGPPTFVYRTGEFWIAHWASTMAISTGLIAAQIALSQRIMLADLGGKRYWINKAVINCLLLIASLAFVNYIYAILPMAETRR